MRSRDREHATLDVRRFAGQVDSGFRSTCPGSLRLTQTAAVLYERSPVFPQSRAIPGRPFPPQAESRTTATELLRPSARLLRPRVLVHGDSGARCTYCRIPESIVGSAALMPAQNFRCLRRVSILRTKFH